MKTILIKHIYTLVTMDEQRRELSDAAIVLDGSRVARIASTGALDVSAGSNTPVLVFIHGGFWQMRSKEDFAFLAEHFLEERISVAMVGYPLAPESGMDEIVADTRSAIRYLARRVPELGGDPHRMVLTGWSSQAGPRAATLRPWCSMSPLCVRA